jgi:pSer/pThr/pTyr-binding forkhead associated (FHA) protein
MKSVPVIKVQIVHILGPLKGQIQEFSDSEISIGRNPSCNVQFPKDLTILSRRHARIVREGNRFKLIDESSNGTFVNGKAVGEAFLKDGDVIMFAEGGPKVSFLTCIVEAPGAMESELPSAARFAAEAPPKPGAPAQPPRPSYTQPPVFSPPQPSEVSVERSQVPLIIQFGPTLRSFKELPVTVGKSPSCHFVISHPGMLDQHAQFFFKFDQYWVKDLTGKQLIRINDRSIDHQSPLSVNDIVSLSPSGPVFRFLGAGRLAEIEESVLSKTDPLPAASAAEDRHAQAPAKPGKGGSILKKFFPR